MFIFYQAAVSGVLTEFTGVKERLREQEILQNDLLITVKDLDKLEVRQKELEGELSLVQLQFSFQPEDVVSFISSAYLQVQEEMLIKLILPGEKTTSDHYFVYPFKIEVLGYYPAILRFIAELEKKPASRISLLDLKKTETSEMVKGVVTWDVYLLLDDEQWAEEKREVIVNLAELELGRENLFQIPEQFRQALIPAIGFETTEEIPVETITELLESTLEVPLENVVLTVIEEEPVFHFSCPYSFPIKRE